MIQIKKIAFSRHFSLILFLLLLLNCKKKDKGNKIFSEHLSFALNQKNYKLNRMKINDSITEIKGHNKQFEIFGKLLNGKQTGWWKIKEINKSTYIYAQYIIITKNKSFLNQYKVYVNNELLKLSSKFYETKIFKNKIRYVFNMPTKKSDTILINDFYYRFSEKGKNLVHPKRKDNFYIQEILLPPNTEKVYGYFTQGVKYRYNLGLNSIYTLDTIR